MPDQDKPPLLIDRLYHSSFRKKTIPGWTDNAAFRMRFQLARRFVLDD